VTTEKIEEEPSVKTILIVVLTYALSTLKEVPVAADNVDHTPVPEAGEVKALKATPSTCLPPIVPTVRSSTVFGVPDPPERENERLTGGRPNAERTWLLKLIIGILIFIPFWLKI